MSDEPRSILELNGTTPVHKAPLEKPQLVGTSPAWPYIYKSEFLGVQVCYVPRMGLAPNLARPLPTVTISDQVARKLKTHGLEYLASAMIRVAQSEIQFDALYVIQRRLPLATFETRVRHPHSGQQVSIFFFVELDGLSRTVVFCEVTPGSPPGGGSRMTGGGGGGGGALVPANDQGDPLALPRTAPMVARAPDCLAKARKAAKRRLALRARAVQAARKIAVEKDLTNVLVETVERGSMVKKLSHPINGATPGFVVRDQALDLDVGIFAAAAMERLLLLKAAHCIAITRINCIVGQFGDDTANVGTPQGFLAESVMGRRPAFGTMEFQPWPTAHSVRGLWHGPLTTPLAWSWVAGKRLLTPSSDLNGSGDDPLSGDVNALGLMHLIEIGCTVVAPVFRDFGVFRHDVASAVCTAHDGVKAYGPPEVLVTEEPPTDEEGCIRLWFGTSSCPWDGTACGSGLWQLSGRRIACLDGVAFAAPSPSRREPVNPWFEPN